MKNNLFLGISTSLFLFAANSLNARGNLAYQSTFNKNEIQNLIINLSSEDLIIENTMNEEITIEVYTNNRKRIPDVIKDKDTLSINTKKNLSIRIGEYCKVYVYIPQENSLSKAKIHLSSGNIELPTFKASKLDIVASSGNIKAKKLLSDECNLLCTSGDIKIETLEGGECNMSSSSGNLSFITVKSQSANFKCTSGNIKIASISCEVFSAITTSGNITIKNATADYFTAKGTSGNLEVELCKAPLAESTLFATSGNISLSIPKTDSFSVEAQTTSGTFNDRIKNIKSVPLYAVFCI